MTIASELDLSFLSRRKVSPVLQNEMSECGLACLCMVANYYGGNFSISELREKLGSSTRGVKLNQLIRMAEEIGLSANPVRVDIEELEYLALPAILHWEHRHFVVVERFFENDAMILDPASGRYKVGSKDLSLKFTGVALELSPNEQFSKGSNQNRLKLSDFVRGNTGLFASLLRIGWVSLLLQVIALTIPLFGQIVIDDVLVSGDTALLTFSGLSFLFLALLAGALSVVRAWLNLSLGSQLNVSWAGQLFGMLIRSPLEFFEKRHIGDVVSRFGSLKQIQALVTTTSTETALDGVMALLTLLVMLSYSIPLTLVSVAAVSVYALYKIYLYYLLRPRIVDALSALARENSHFIESVRAVQTVKSMGLEGVREQGWKNIIVDSTNANIRTQRVEVLQQTFAGFVGTTETIMVIWLGGLAVLSNTLTVGMLVAYLAYRALFSARTIRFIDHCQTISLATVHLDRLSDLVNGSETPTMQGQLRKPMKGNIEVRSISFSYSRFEEPVLSKVSLEITAGESVALFAPSGFGKTTLAKLILGLLKPTDGEVLIDGTGITDWSPQSLRDQMHAVMQDDLLLSGTIRENIAMFGMESDDRQVRRAAEIAEIDKDIRDMPLGYESYVNDLGTSLSRGQMQRILIARAVYSIPKVLLLDEATSNVDLETEARIDKNLRELQLTRIVIAHRQETLESCDRVVNLQRLN